MNDFLEKDLENIIYENKDRVTERGFCDLSWGTIERQSRLPSGKIVDLLVYESYIELNMIKFKIIELKKGEIDLVALLQLISYYEELTKDAAKSHKCEASILLCGRTIHPTVFEICKMIENIELYEYDYSFDGIYFKNKTYCLRESSNSTLELLKAV